jgi:hypothetical protein
LSVARVSTIVATTLASALALASPAHATLGGTVRSVEDDRVEIAGTLSTTVSDAYAVHEIRTKAGSTVREFVSAAGQVFGIAWEGPRVPDLRQLLGASFDAYAAAARQRAGHHGPLRIELPGLVVESSGHARAFRGRALIPELVPAGIGSDAVR